MTNLAKLRAERDALAGRGGTRIIRDESAHDPEEQA